MDKFTAVISVEDGGTYLVLVEAQSAAEAKDKVESNRVFNSDFDTVAAVFAGAPIYSHDYTEWKEMWPAA